MIRETRTIVDKSRAPARAVTRSASGSMSSVASAAARAPRAAAIDACTSPNSSSFANGLTHACARDADERAAAKAKRASYVDRLKQRCGVVKRRQRRDGDAERARRRASESTQPRLGADVVDGVNGAQCTEQLGVHFALLF